LRTTVLLLTLAFANAQAPVAERPAPEQPLPFSHKHHAGTLKLACKQCHTIPDPGDFATLPPTKTCMGCHASVKTDSPHIMKLAAADKEGKKIPWVRVYKIPDYVGFSHKVHTSVNGVNCETCHGPVAERAVLRREKEINMSSCMDCHRRHEASNHCLFCHDQR
jgi:hypothetical protein